jgi:hypothetical protein
MIRGGWQLSLNEFSLWNHVKTSYTVLDDQGVI